MTLPVGVQAVNVLYTLVSLYFTEKRLDLLEKMIEYMYEIADREVALAELIFELHKALRERDQEYFAIANGAPIHEQKYDCALASANGEVIRDINRLMYRKLSSTDMYSSGLRRDIVETAMSSIVEESAAQFTMAYKNEDAFHDATYLNKYKHIAASVREARLNVNTKAFASVTNTVSDIAKAAAGSAGDHLETTVSGITSIALGVADRNAAKAPRATQGPVTTTTLESGARVSTGAGQQLPATPTTISAIPVVTIDTTRSTITPATSLNADQ